MGKELVPRLVLEELWRERTQIACTKYRTAREAARIAKEVRIDAPAPDGVFAMRQAIQAENAALTEYRRVLTIFSDLVAYGKIPGEETSR